jgi:hypothetical protein
VPERIDLLVQDVQSHSKSISELTARMAGYEKLIAVREVEDKYLEQRLARIERIGWAILFAFISVFIAASANFIVSGGLSIAK